MRRTHHVSRLTIHDPDSQLSKAQHHPVESNTRCAAHTTSHVSRLTILVFFSCVDGILRLSRRSKISPRLRTGHLWSSQHSPLTKAAAPTPGESDTRRAALTLYVSRLTIHTHHSPLTPHPSPFKISAICTTLTALFFLFSIPSRCIRHDRSDEVMNSAPFFS